MKLFIVQGETGEYSDNRWWLVKAFTNEDKAKEYLEKCEARAKEIEATRIAVSEWDPQLQMDYTGSFYNIVEVELDNV